MSDVTEVTLTNEVETLDIEGILKSIPHRYPFLLVDRVTSLVKGESIVAVKNVTVNEPCFQGHFPNKPVFPGVLLLEAMAQATGILTSVSSDREAEEGSLFYLVGIDNARFRRPVLPGDQVILEAEIVRAKRDMWKYATRAKVDGDVVCSADLMGAYKAG